MLDSRTPRCESMNVSAALYRSGSSVSRGSPTRRIMSRGATSRWAELDVRIHHLGVLSTEPVAQTGEKPLRDSGGEVVANRNPHQNEELVRAHLDRTQVDDLVDPWLPRDRGSERVEHLVGRSFSDDQPARAPRELIGDVDEDGPDHGARERVEPVIRRQCSQSQTGERRPQTRERGAVFIEDGPESGVAQLLEELAHRYARLAGSVFHFAHGHAQ